MKHIKSIQPKPELFEKIADLQDEISGLEKTITLEESKSAHENWIKGYQNLELLQEDPKKYESLFQEATLYSRTQDLERLQGTLGQDLVHLPQRYIISDSQDPILSPSGYHPNERVFVRPSGNVLINSSRLPKALSGLFFFDQDKRC